MKSLAFVPLMTVVAATLTACGEADSGSDPTATPEYEMIAIPRDGSPVDAAGDPVAPEVPAPTESSATPTSGSTATPSPTRPPVPTVAPFATPVPIDRGEVSGGLWDLALLTIEDMPPGSEWTAEPLDRTGSDGSTVCGASDPTDTAAYFNASAGVIFFESTTLVSVQEMITEYVTPDAAQQVLLDLQHYYETLGACVGDQSEDGGDSSVQEKQPELEIVPVDPSPVGDDQIGYRVMISDSDAEPEAHLEVEVVAVRVDQMLVVISIQNWQAEVPSLDASLIERAVEKVELALTDPPVPTQPSDGTGTAIAELDVSTILTCEQAAEEVLTRIQAVLNILAPLSPSELSSLEDLPGVNELGREIEEVEHQASEIGCEAAEFGALVASGIEHLEWSSPTAQLFAEAIRSHYLFEYSESE